MMQTRCGIAFALSAALFVGAGVVPVNAQSSDQRAEARDLFDSAVRAIGDGRFAEARDLLQRSLTLFPNTSTAFNLAVALRGTGQSVASVEVFDRILAAEFGALSPGQRTQAQGLREETAREVATLRITASGQGRLRVAVGASEVGVVDGRGTVEARVDAGEHVVSAQNERGDRAEERVAVARGGSVDVTLRVAREPSSDAGLLIVTTTRAEDLVEIVGVARAPGRVEERVAPGRYRVRVTGPEGAEETVVTVRAGRRTARTIDPPSASWTDSPWFWAGLGAVALGAGAAIVITTTGGTESPYADPVFGVVEALGGR